MENRFKECVLVMLTLFIALSSAGCSSMDQRVELGYEKVVSAQGGSGDLYIAKAAEKHAAVRKPSGTLMIGMVKGTDRDVVTSDNVSEWLTLALVQELYAAGFNVRTVDDLPLNASRGLKTDILSLTANQSVDFLTVTTTTGLQVSVEIWQEGKKSQALTINAGNEEKGADRSSAPISQSLRKSLQNLMRQLVPDIVKALQH